jgi:hypothetical protein
MTAPVILAGSHADITRRLQSTIDAAQSHPDFAPKMMRNDMRAAVLCVVEANAALDAKDFVGASAKLGEARAFLKLAGEQADTARAAS